MRCVATAPTTKPSIQTRFMLDTMATVEKAEAEKWEKMFTALEAISQQLDGMEEVQKVLLGQ